MVVAWLWLAVGGAAVRAASVTVEFKPEAGKPAEYKQVNVHVLPRAEGGEKAKSISFRSEEKAFKKTFDNLAPGAYDIWTHTGDTPFMADADTPGLFRFFFYVELKDDKDHQNVLVQYKYFDPSTVKGAEVATGKVTESDGKPVGGLALRLATDVKGVGTVVVARATTGADGAFEARGLVKGSQYRVIDAEERVLGSLEPGKPATLALAPKVGMAAPDFEVVDIATGAKRRLADWKGKVVVVDFWATWCGPCQEPMAKMQTYRDKHPEWGDRVVLVALSLDDTKEAAAKHLKAKGWDKTVNAWAGEGAFESPVAQAYRIDGIPKVYVIGRDGKVAAAGHPATLDVAEIVGKYVGAER